VAALEVVYGEAEEVEVSLTTRIQAHLFVWLPTIAHPDTPGGHRIIGCDGSSSTEGRRPRRGRGDESSMIERVFPTRLSTENRPALYLDDPRTP